MKAQAQGRLTAILNVLDGIFSITALGLLLYVIRREGELYLSEVMVWERGWLRVAGFFFALALSRVVQTFNAARRGRTAVISQALYAAATLAGGVIVLVRNPGFALDLQAPELSGTLGNVGRIYAAALLASRVLAIIRDHSWRSVLMNVLLGLGALMLMEEFAYPLTICVILLQSILHIASLALARIDMSILKRIIRKTYAAEILFGIVMLIAAFSMLLPLFEDGIETVGDALWYCFAIVTTIGFGDFAAVSPVGRVMSVILGIYGIIVVSLVTSIIVNFYGEMKKIDGDGEDE